MINLGSFSNEVWSCKKDVTFQELLLLVPYKRKMETTVRLLVSRGTGNTYKLIIRIYI